MTTFSIPNARELFGRVFALPEEDRARALAEARQFHPELADEVESLIEATELAGPFLSGNQAASPDASALTIGPERLPRAARVEEGPGSVVGRYTLEERIGDGGFGVVYRARSASPLHTRVAIKIIKPGMDSAQVNARFEQERQALSMMDHPNIARVIDAGKTDSGRPYVVMELVEGPSIIEYCRKHSLSITRRLALFTDVCRAVQHAHQKGIIHRDIKPSNVLVTEVDGVSTPKVIDFGIAKALHGKLPGQTIFTEFRALIGTPEYMSPEQANPGGGGVDTRTDIYALGVMLYELLTGTTPHTAEELRRAAWDEMQRILREVDPPAPSTRLNAAAGAETDPRSRTRVYRLSRSVHGEIDWITMKALDKDRSRRYATAEHLARDIELYLRDEPISAGPPSVWYRFSKICRRHRVVVAASLAVLFCLAGGFAAAAAGWRDAARQRDATASALISEQSALGAERQARSVAALAAEESERQRQLAERSNARYAAVQEMFLERPFRAFNPEGNQGRDITLAEYIDRITSLAQRSDDPFVSAVMRARLGEMAASLGREREALDHLDAALAHFAECDEGESADAARAMAKHAELRKRLGGLSPDDPILLRAIALLSRHHGESSWQVVDASEIRCASLYDAGRDAEAAALNVELLEACENLPEGRDALVQRIDLSVLYASYLSRTGRPSEASGLLKRTAALAREGILVEGRLATCLSLLGENLAQIGRHDEALRALVEALDISERLYGADSTRAAYTLRRLGTLYMQRRQPEAGMPYAQKAAAIYAARRGEQHRETASARGALGCLLASQGRYAEALVEFEKAVSVHVSLQPPVPESAVASLGLLGACLTELGRYDEAQAALARAIDWPYPGPAGATERARNLARMVELQHRRGDEAAAARWKAELDRAPDSTP